MAKTGQKLSSLDKMKNYLNNKNTSSEKLDDAKATKHKDVLENIMDYIVRSEFVNETQKVSPVIKGRLSHGRRFEKDDILSIQNDELYNYYKQKIEKFTYKNNIDDDIIVM